MIIKYVYILVLASIFRITVLSFEPCNTAQILQYAQLLGTKQDSCHYLVVHNLYYVNQTGQFTPPYAPVILRDIVYAAYSDNHCQYRVVHRSSTVQAIVCISCA